MNPQMYATFGPNRSSRLADFPGFEFVYPIKLPWTIEGLIGLAYVHAQMNPHMYATCGDIRSSHLVDFPDFFTH